MDDTGGAFAMGAIGGGIWHFLKVGVCGRAAAPAGPAHAMAQPRPPAQRAKNTSTGGRLQSGMVAALRRGPRVGGTHTFCAGLPLPLGALVRERPTECSRAGAVNFAMWGLSFSTFSCGIGALARSPVHALRQMCANASAG